MTCDVNIDILLVMTNATWNFYARLNGKWRQLFKQYCAAQDITMESLVVEALRDVAKKKGIRLP